jgi:predicted AAA+ superfamily ATPase
VTDASALDRIAAALERLAPPPPTAADPLAFPAYAWRGGQLEAIALEALPLERLIGIDRQRDALVENLRRLALRACGA